MPLGRDARSYGDSSTQWRPFPQQEVPLAEYARRIAERLDFRVELIGIGDSGEPVPSKPGIVLIDPWLLASKDGRRALRSAVHNLRPWVLPLLVLSPPTDRATGELAQQARDILSATLPTESLHRAPRSVNSLKDFVSIVPMLVAEAERQYFRRNRVAVPLRPPPKRPILSDAAPQHTDTSSPRPTREEPDA